MNPISIDLTFVTLVCMLVTVSFHRHLIITSPQHLPGHCVPLSVSSKGAFVDLVHQQICFSFIHASEQNHVEVSLIQHITIQEKIARQSSQSLLVFIGSSGWILLILQETLDIMEPRLVVSNFFGREYIHMSFKTSDFDQWHIILAVHFVHRR